MISTPHGSTIKACAHALREAGVEQIGVLVIAKD